LARRVIWVVLVTALVATTVTLVFWQQDRPSPTVEVGATPDRSRPTSTAPPRTSPSILVPVVDRDLLDSHPARLEDLPDGTAVAPVGVRIDRPDIGGSAIAAGVESSGAMAVGTDPLVLAWYRYGPSPGEEGSSVIAGHVDYNGRPGVFYRLAEVTPGASVIVTYADRTERRFVVVARRHFPKSDLPVDQIFSRTGRPQLVLITCGGEFDDAARSYRENVVVYAEPA